MSWGGGETAVLTPATNGEFGGNEWDTGGGAAASSGWETKSASNEKNGDDFGEFGDGGRVNDGKCYNCGEEGHNRADCPKPSACRYCKKDGHIIADCPEAPKGCRRCGDEGHLERDCSQPLVCKNCNEDGHYARECPSRVCGNCGKTGHIRNDCKDARLVDRSQFPDKTVEEAWAMIAKGVSELDIDDVKEAVQVYLKASPDTTYPQLEEAFRKQGVGLHLIALEKTNQAITFTNMDLQGNMDKKYTVNYRFSDKPKRPREAEDWPASPEENLERLSDAGDVVERGLPKCSNCNELGHISKSCPQEKQEPANRAIIQCFNCNEEGHRIRDCPTPRVDKFACKNCGKGGHISKECPEPRNPATVLCKKCEEMGHFARDCPKDARPCHNCGEIGHMAKDCTAPPKCRNCDEIGHSGKECPKPRDYSRVKCSNCNEMGHTKVRCKQPVPAEDGEGGGGFENSGGFDNAGSNGPENVAGGDEWESGFAAGGAAGGAAW